MLSFSVNDVKAFMGKLLKSELFDAFDLHSFAIHSFAVFEMHKHPAGVPPAWAQARVYAFDIIKGSKAPSYMKVVLARADGDDLLFLNVLFEDGGIVLTSGMSQKSFSMDKSKYQAWNEFIVDFLAKNEIEYTNNLE